MYQRVNVCAQDRQGVCVCESAREIRCVRVRMKLEQLRHDDVRILELMRVREVIM